MPGVIDVHAHIVPPFYAKAVVDAGLVDARGRAATDGYPLPDWSLDDTLRCMDTHDVDASVLSITAPGVSFLPHEDQAPLARRLNEELAAVVRAHPRRFANMAILPLPDVDAAASELRFALDQHGFDGVALYSNFSGRYLGDPMFDPIMAQLHERTATVFVHPAQPPGFEAYGLGFPAPILEYPFDSTRMLANLLRNRVLERFDRITFIIPHGGGVFPYIATRILGAVSSRALGGQYASIADAARQVSRIVYDLTAMGRDTNLRMLRDGVGADRLVVGYDYPFIPEVTIPAHIKAFDRFDGFSDADKTKIRTGNALKLFPRLAGARSV